MFRNLTFAMRCVQCGHERDVPRPLDYPKTHVHFDNRRSPEIGLPRAHSVPTRDGNDGVGLGGGPRCPLPFVTVMA